MALYPKLTKAAKKFLYLALPELFEKDISRSFEEDWNVG